MQDAASELRRIPILRTPVNKGMKMGQSLQGPWPVRLLTTNRAALEPTAGAFPASYYSRLHPPVELVLSGESVMQFLVSCAMLSPKKAEMLFAW